MRDATVKTWKRIKAGHLRRMSKRSTNRALQIARYIYLAITERADNRKINGRGALVQIIQPINPNHFSGRVFTAARFQKGRFNAWRKRVTARCASCMNGPSGMGPAIRVDTI